jgi:hypothetical protein
MVRHVLMYALGTSDNFKKLIEHVEKEGPLLALDLGGALIGSDGTPYSVLEHYYCVNTTA